MSRRVATGVAFAPPHRPPWYPNQDPHHNPWTIGDALNNKTHYAIWADSLAPGELVRLIKEHRASAETEEVVA